MQGYVESAVQGRAPAHWLWDFGQVATISESVSHVRLLTPPTSAVVVKLKGNIVSQVPDT